MTFGVIAPPALLLLERRDTEWFWGVVLPHRPYTSLHVWLAAGLLALWLLFGRRSRRLAAAWAGALGAAACGSAVIGCLVLPYTLSALNEFRVGIKFLGFIPFVTASVLLGAATDALRRAIDGADLRCVVVLAFLGVSALTCADWGGGFAADRQTEKYVSKIVWGSRRSGKAKHMLSILWVFPGVRLDALHDAMVDAVGRRDTTEYQSLLDAYYEITGRRHASDPRD